MANPGNTGKRYKLATLKRLVITGTTLEKHLSCGHIVRHEYGTAAEAEEMAGYDRVGTKRRCVQCPAS